MIDAVICIIVVVLCVFGVKTYVGKLSHGCCGSGGAVKKRKPADSDISHYPYTYIVDIEGMTCKNCAARIENAFNTSESGNFYAHVKLNKKRAVVHSKEELPEEELRKIVVKAGYSVANVTKEK